MRVAADAAFIPTSRNVRFDFAEPVIDYKYYGMSARIRYFINMVYVIRFDRPPPTPPKRNPRLTFVSTCRT